QLRFGHYRQAAHRAEVDARQAARVELDGLQHGVGEVHQSELAALEPAVRELRALERHLTQVTIDEGAFDQHSSSELHLAWRQPLEDLVGEACLIAQLARHAGHITARNEPTSRTEVSGHSRSVTRYVTTT